MITILLLLNLILSSLAFDEKIKQANLATKTDIAYFIIKTTFEETLRTMNNKAISNKIRHRLKEN